VKEAPLRQDETDELTATLEAPGFKPRRPTEDEVSREVLRQIQTAFQTFDNQSTQLQRSFENLKQNLAEANRELNVKNQALSDKVMELQQMSSRLHCILESLGDGVLVVNSAFVVERCNPAAQSLLNMDRQQIEQKPYSEVMNGLGNRESLRVAIEQGIPRLDEQRHGSGYRGQKTVVLASVSPIRSADGSILGAVEVLRDVTQLRLLEERLQQQKRMAALGEMASCVAHEIRNPLGTIEGFARLLRQDLTDEGRSDQLRLTSKIIEGAQNLNYVITNLLTYVRPMTMQCETFDVSVLLGSVEELLTALALERGVTLRMEAGKEPRQLQGDIRQLRQLLVNLGRNALEACKKGGKVSIRGEGRGHEAVFVVTDNGCGISKENLPRIFDPFFTLKEGGTGLGLALCHRIAEAHGGEIRVESVEGEGTVVRLILPC
jgi:PAS domain S-box-containing protein